MEQPEKNVKRRLSADERQQEIVRVAMELAARQGVDEVTTQDMAQAMNLTQGAIFRHFPTKDAIWLAAMRWVREQLMKVVEKAARGAVDPLDALERMFFAHLAFIGKHPAIPRLVFFDQLQRKNPELKRLIQEIMTGYEARIATLLAEAKNAGLVRADLDENSAATLFIGMIQGLVIQSSIFGNTRSIKEQAQQVFPIYLAGVRAPAKE